MLTIKPLSTYCISTVLILGLIFSNLAVASNGMHHAPNAVTTVFPAASAMALRQDVSKRTGIPVNVIKVIKTAPRTWPNGCLGVPEPDEMCSQALIEGWLVTIFDGSRRWEYHTNETGLTFRLAHAP